MSSRKIERAEVDSGDATRRQFLRRIAVAGVGAAGLTLLSERPAQADDRIPTELWTHGTSVAVEYPERTSGISRHGFDTYIQQAAGENWFHFAVPTPGILYSRAPWIDRVYVTFMTSGPGVLVQRIDVFVGQARQASQVFDPPRSGDNSTSLNCPYVSLPGGGPLVFFKGGVGVSVDVMFNESGWIAFYGAGASFLSEPLRPVVIQVPRVG